MTTLSATTKAAGLPSSPATPRIVGRLASMTVQAKLRLIAALVSVGLLVVGCVSEIALARTQSVTDEVVRRAAALSLLQTADMSHDGLRSVVYASLLVGQVAEVSADEVRKDAKMHAKSLREALSGMAAIDFGSEAHDQLLAVLWMRWSRSRG